MDGGVDEKVVRLRFTGTCRICGLTLPAKTPAVYERASRTIRCLDHVETMVTSDSDHESEVTSDPEPEGTDEVQTGNAGASARREFERRTAKREERIRTRSPRLGGLILALSEQPQSTTAWRTGAAGEEKLGRGLDQRSSGSVRLLHDRRIPRSRANIDHLALTASGIYVIDAKNYRGRPHLTVEGGLLRPRTEKLLVGTRHCSSLVDGVLKQVEVVRAQLADADEVPIHGVLCFVEAEWPLLGGSFTTRGVQVLWPKKLYRQLEGAGELSPGVIDGLHRRLARALPPA